MRRSLTLTVCPLLGTALLALSPVPCPAGPNAGPEEFEQRLEELREQTELAASRLRQAEGFPRQTGLIDLQIARFFADYISWELAHPVLMKDALLSSAQFDDRQRIDPAEGDRRYRFHLNRELTESRQLLDNAMARLDRDGSWPTVPEIAWEDMRYDDGFFRVGGNPVFPGGFNMLARSLVDLEEHPGWTERDAVLTREFTREMRALGVGIVGKGVSIPGLLLPDGSINTTAITKLAEEIRLQGRNGFKVDILLHWAGDQEVLEGLWPGITARYGNSVRLDIDHPGTRQLVTRVMAELIPALGKLSSILSWDLANEPFFSLDQWSSHTLKRYHAWLAGCHGSVDLLNSRWNTDYPDFASIPLPNNMPRARCSPGEWHDRVTFHNHRVKRFFELVRDEIHKHHPDAVIHIKLQDNNSLGPLPWAVTDGIDREMLTPLTTLHGVDTRPLPVTEPRMAATSKNGAPPPVLDYDESPYGFHWLGQSFLYDYLTSLEPRQPIVDFEYHAFSINPIRIPDLKPSHARATLWLAHLHGLIGNMAWYWHRRYGPHPFPNKYFKMWLHNSISTQPLIAAEYFHTMRMLNTCAEEVAALATVPEAPVRLFVSKPSYQQNQRHINALHRAYEGTCFHGVRIGFVTERMLIDHGVPADCKVLVIPDAGYVDPAALRALESGGKKGVGLIRFGNLAPAHDAHGAARPGVTTRFLDTLPALHHAAAPELSRAFATLLAPLIPDPPVRVIVGDGPGAFGVMHRQARVNGELVLLLVNVRKEAVRVRLKTANGATIKGRDLLHHEDIGGGGFPLPFQGVRLIRFSM